MGCRASTDSDSAAASSWAALLAAGAASLLPLASVSFLRLPSARIRRPRRHQNLARAGEAVPPALRSTGGRLGPRLVKRRCWLSADDAGLLLAAPGVPHIARHHRRLAELHIRLARRALCGAAALIVVDVAGGLGGLGCGDQDECCPEERVQHGWRQRPDPLHGDGDGASTATAASAETDVRELSARHAPRALPLDPSPSPRRAARGVWLSIGLLALI